MNTTKTYLTGLAAAAVLERHFATSPALKNIGIQLHRLGHRSAVLHIPPEPKDANGGIDLGVLLAAMNIAVSLVAFSTVSEPLHWAIKEIGLRRVARERRASWVVTAESEDLDWNSPGEKTVKVSIAIDVIGGDAEPSFIGESVVAITERQSIQ